MCKGEAMINLEDIFNDINKKHFNNMITPIPIVWNSKLRVCAGKCYFKSNFLTPVRIEISKPIFQKLNNSDKVWKTVAHEMTHAYLLEHNKERGHTQNFQDIMTRITGDNKNHRCHNYDVTGLRNNKNYFYHCECGLTEGYRAKAPKKGGIYTAKCCNGIVSFSKIIIDKPEAKKQNSSTFKKLF